MKKALTFLLFILFSINLLGQQGSVLYGNMIKSVFYIRVPTNINNTSFSYGTCFFVYHDSSTYMVTAKHVIPSSVLLNKTISFQLFRDKKWESFTLAPMFHKNNKVDIVAFKIPVEERLSGITITSKSVLISCEAFVAGFPNHIKSIPNNSNFNNGLPLAIIKKGIISAQITENNIGYFLVDIVGNKVYSGGPVFTWDRVNNTWALSGVISQRVPNKLINSDPNYFETGFVLATSFRLLLDIINQ